MKSVNSSINSVIANLRKLVDGDRLVVCCSGGADSMALLFCAKLVFNDLLVLHIQHDMRSKEETSVDRELVRAFSAKSKLDFEVAEVNLRDMENQPGSEAEYREHRYDKIIQLCKLYDFNYAATGHHADDQLETILMKLCRGAGLRGMSGIAATQHIDGIDFIRPMLNLSKTEVYEICEKKNIPFVEDQTNADNNYARNAIRNNVIPALRSIYPQAAKNSVHLAETMSATQLLIDQNTSQLKAYEIDDYAIRIEALQVSNDLVVYEWLRKTCFQVDSNFAIDCLNKVEVDKVINAIRTRQNKTFTWPSQIKISVNSSIVKVRKY